MKILARSAIPIGLTALCACADGNLPDYNQLGGLRVLALKADQPEVDPSPTPTVTITPVVSDLNQGRALSYSAVACVDPGVGLGATPSCDGVPGATALSSGAIPPVGSAALKTRTGVAPAIPVPVPSGILANRTPTDQFNGVAYLVVYTLKAANPDGSTSQVVSIKRIIASTRPTKNANPTLSDVTAGDQPFSAYLASLAYPGGGAQPAALLTPVLAAGSAETYQQMSQNGAIGARTEQFTTTWFISNGSIAFFRTQGTDADGWTPPSSQPAFSDGVEHGLVFVVVTRDGRGGEDFKIFER